MAAHVLRLRLALFAGAFRGGPRTALRAALLFIGAIALTIVVCTVVLSLRDASAAVAQTAVVLTGSVVVLACVAAPLVGVLEDQLDPRRFAVFGAQPRPLAAVLAGAALLSVPSLCLIAVGVSVVALWTAHGVAWPLAAASAALGVLTCVLAVKVSMALSALVLQERRSRELTGLMLVALLAVVVPIGIFFASLEWRGRVPTPLLAVADVLAITPLGAAWAPAGTTGGGWSIVIAALVVGLLVALWFLLVERLLTTTTRPVSGKERRGLGWFGVAPGTPTGAIAARSLTYWFSDARYLVNVAVIPVAAVVAVLPLLIVGVPMQIVALIPAPLMALFLGWLAHNDLAYDSTALWMHIAAGVRGVSDRLGRLVPVTLISIPLLAAAVSISIMLHGSWSLLPAMSGVCISLFLCGLGASSVASALAPYPASRPGDSPFQQPQRTGGALAQGAVLVVAIALTLPVLWLAWLALDRTDDAAWDALRAGLVIGCSTLVLGVVLGGWAFRRRSGRLMEFAAST